MPAKPGIDHIIVLMLENRSFDCMLGNLYPRSPLFEGISDDLSNSLGSTRYPVWKSSVVDVVSSRIPEIDPGESYADMCEQLFGDATNLTMPPTMGGFVQNFSKQRDGTKMPDLFDVMHYFTPDQLPVLSTLAKSFGVCDQWFASAPCQTWPNRFFAHTGTCLGYVNNADFPIPFPAPSIFKRLADHHKTWRVYFHDLPQSILLRDVWPYAPTNYRHFHQFLIDAENGALPQYSFIEPRYFADMLENEVPSDQHPPHDVLHGEVLLETIYNTLRASPCWERSLWIITYDEHGGCYDHVPPPAAPPQDYNAEYKFPFNRFGVRVPAVLVSPFIPAGTIVRSPNGVFDHTSILATVLEQFGIDATMTARVSAAPSVLSALTLADPVNDGPSHVTALDPHVVTGETDWLATKPLNALQQALTNACAQLPSFPLTTALTSRVSALADDAATAVMRACAQLRAFLGIS